MCTILLTYESLSYVHKQTAHLNRIYISVQRTRCAVLFESFVAEFTGLSFLKEGVILRGRKFGCVTFFEIWVHDLKKRKFEIWVDDFEKRTFFEIWVHDKKNRKF